MPKDLLLEIGLEEVPARFIRAAMEQLKEKTVKWLSEARIGHGEVKAYATPRRLAVYIQSVEEKQTDVNEEVKGPSRKIALDETGAWSKAAQGFARSQGVDPESFYFQELGGVEYIYAKKSSVGTATSSLLNEALPAIITSMTFPKNMRWGAWDLKFVRPIRWMVALFGEEVVPFEIAGVSTGRISRGHRFLGNDTEIGSPSAYADTLKEESVYVDVEERQGLILEGIQSLSKDKGWTISIKEDLLEEVLFLVEYPTVLFGTFDPDFLTIPQDVLITSMREHQRYFPVLNHDGELLPYFVTVRNGNEVALEQVAKGNEKVLRARLSDARFFYREDQKLPIATALDKLETIVFHEELGTVADKVRRIGKLAGMLSGIMKVDQVTAFHIERTAAICKFDLVTQMVYEFPELQGVMGEDYARKAGEPEPVAKGIFEHYQPRFSGDQSPASQVGAIVSIADKLDTIVGCFSIGIIPTGSQDPYALRRQAAGIVQMMLDHPTECTLAEAFRAALSVHRDAGLLKRDAEGIEKDLHDFFGLRVKNVLSEQARYDVVDAVLASGYNDISSVVRRGEALMEAVQQPDFKITVESFNRVNNLAGKATAHTVDASLFTESVEHDLYTRWLEIQGRYEHLLNQGMEGQALAALAELKPAVTAYFDKVMVMADDDNIRSNRLATLHAISGGLKKFADFSKLVW
ncbi:glycine-tRNA synthetase subunit beta [Paenibacillus swuensis]|uniref:Glycine--tRNA ligase beta subunit n=1 Tax=Paenibacillus swuensis TaxID=1178515 RepID=A0A172TK28_9BACL|nr:glycine--tRNA ligase subunit beta [Paenibacillus swuensis]ANE47326.1 glycine-tRNA synthetase subunit beta [Paenibacillus swuensis]